MSIEAKHAYRFGYLKSDKWQNVRLEALVREKGKCQICGEESIFNDAHHMWYPENIYETTEAHLVILCRGCHGFIHTMIPECKTNDEEAGRAHWKRFADAIKIWRLEKHEIFAHVEDPSNMKAAELRKAYNSMKVRCKGYVEVIRGLDPDFRFDLMVPECKNQDEKVENFPKSVEKVIRQIRSWANAYQVVELQKAVDNAVSKV